MAIIPATFAQVNLIFSGPGVPTGAQVTYGIALGSVTDPEAVATNEIAFWESDLKEVTPAAVQLDSVIVKMGPNDTGPFAEVGHNVFGTGSAGEVQPNMAILVQKRTLLGGRRNRGRLYWPCAEDAVDQGGVIDGVVLGVVQDQFDSWASGHTSELFPLVVLHSSAPTTPTAITGLSVQSLAATQRRRLRR